MSAPGDKNTQLTATANDSSRLKHRRKQRLEILAMVAASYLADTVLMLVLWAAGALEVVVPLTYIGSAAIVCGAMYVIYSGGWTERFRDHYLVVPFLLANSLINIGCIAFVPQIGVLMLMVLFVIFSFAALRMSLRNVIVSSIIVAILVAVVMVWLGDRLTLPMANGQQRAISALWFSLILLRSVLLGMYSSQLRELLAKRNKQLAETFEKLDQLATHDELTGMLNRRAIMQLLEEERQRMVRTGQAFGVALLDIDHFKHINDGFGHLVGDEVLRCFAETLAGTLRNTDRVGRYGGEEFLVLFTSMGSEAIAVYATNRLRTQVAKHNWDPITPGHPVTVSAGVTICCKDESAEEMLARVDEALYAAKREGRDCVRFK